MISSQYKSINFDGSFFRRKVDDFVLCCGPGGREDDFRAEFSTIWRIIPSVINSLWWLCLIRRFPPCNYEQNLKSPQTSLLEIFSFLFVASFGRNFKCKPQNLRPWVHRYLQEASSIHQAQRELSPQQQQHFSKLKIVKNHRKAKQIKQFMHQFCSMLVVSLDFFPFIILNSSLFADVFTTTTTKAIQLRGEERKGRSGIKVSSIMMNHSESWCNLFSHLYRFAVYRICWMSHITQESLPSLVFLILDDDSLFWDYSFAAAAAADVASSSYDLCWQ